MIKVGPLIFMKLPLVHSSRTCSKASSRVPFLASLDKVGYVNIKDLAAFKVYY